MWINTLTLHQDSDKTRFSVVYLNERSERIIILNVSLNMMYNLDIKNKINVLLKHCFTINHIVHYLFNIKDSNLQVAKLMNESLRNALFFQHKSFSGLWSCTLLSTRMLPENLGTCWSPITAKDSQCCLHMSQFCIKAGSHWVVTLGDKLQTAFANEFPKLWKCSQSFLTHAQ